MSTPPTSTRPAAGTPHPAQDVDELALPVARDARDAEDLAAVDLERDVLEPLPRHAVDLQRDRAPACAASERRTPIVGRPTISEASSRSSTSAVARVPTTTPRRSTVTRDEICRTSCSLWLMKTIAMPSSRRRRSVANSASTSCGTSTAVGSSRIRTRQSR